MNLERAFSLIRQLQGVLAALKGKSIRFGFRSLTWPGGSPFSDTSTFAHGLAGPPDLILFTPGSQFRVIRAVAWTSTTITAQGVEPSGSSPALGNTCSFFWLAIG